MGWKNTTAKIAEVFAIEDEVVGGIVEALGIKPTAAEAGQLTRLPTANLEAYDYYLRGEQAARSGLRPQLRRALEFYVKAGRSIPPCRSLRGRRTNLRLRLAQRL